MRTLREWLKKQDPRHVTVKLVHHVSVTVVGARGDLLRPGSAEFRGSLLGFVPGELSCERVCWTGKFAGR